MRRSSAFSLPDLAAKPVSAWAMNICVQIAVVVVGGTLIGGRGHYIGMLGGALLLTALQTLLDGTTLPHATRNIIFGVVLLGAVVSLRDRST